MKLRLSLLVALVIAACGRELPSTTPLGGRLDDGFEEGYTPDRRARAVDAGAALPEVAAASDDAGAADAGVASQQIADAGASDAGAGEPSSAVAVKWEGEYVGSDVTTTNLEGLSRSVQPDDKARTRVEDKGGGRVVFIIVDSSNGNPLCTVKANTSGDRATIEPNQDCFSTAEADVTIQSGSAGLQGDRLTLDLEAALESASADMKVTGTIAYHFEGKRQ
jgi:hypothetical protein